MVKLMMKIREKSRAGEMTGGCQTDDGGTVVVRWCRLGVFKTGPDFSDT